MTKLAAMIIFSLFAVLTPVAAQEENNQDLNENNNTSILFPALIQCDLVVENILDLVVGKYGEEPFAVGSIVLQHAGNYQFYPAIMYITVNPQTGSFSIIGVFKEDNVGCLIAGGNAFSPAITTPKINL